MGRNGWTFLILLVLAVGWNVGVSVVSSWVLADMAGRPITALTSPQGKRIAAKVPGGAAGPDMAQIGGTRSRTLGFDAVYIVPDGTAVTCRYRLSGATCDSGWLPERADG